METKILIFGSASVKAVSFFLSHCCTRSI